MANIAIDAIKEMTYDAIVIGSGITGAGLPKNFGAFAGWRIFACYGVKLCRNLFSGADRQKV